MGLTLAFKEKYGDEALKVTQTFAEQMGTMLGNKVKEKADIRGSGIREVERVFHAWLGPVLAHQKLDSRVEGNIMTVTRVTPCPGLIVAKQMNLPLEKVCNTVNIPMFMFNILLKWPTSNASEVTKQGTRKKINCFSIMAYDSDSFDIKKKKATRYNVIKK